MPKRTVHLLIDDMLLACERISSYTQPLTFEQFINDPKTVDATVRNIQILGEAASQVPHDFKAAYPEIEWSKIIRSRHILVHEYFDLDYGIIWKLYGNTFHHSPKA
jgi:uncharacterized protein with HEPN domain